MSEAAERLAAIHAASFESPWPAEDFDRLLRQPEVSLLEKGDAFVLLRTVAGESEILTLAVAPASRRQGLARDLVVEAFAGAAARGAVAIFLEVAADNPAAIALYRQAGFRQVGVRRAYYARRQAPFVDALVLRCDLNSPPA